MIESADIYPSPAASGLKIHRRIWRPDQAEPTGRVLMLHGLGDHLGCHRVAAELFCARGYACAGIDSPGHGLSGGKRGHVDSLATLFGLIDETIAWMDAETGAPGQRILYAHSTGAYIALHYLLLRSTQQGQVAGQTLFDRIWLGSPLLDPEHGHHPLLITLVGWIAKVAPSLRFDTRVSPEQCHHIVPGTENDEEETLRHHCFSAALGADIQRHVPRTRDTAAMLMDPVSVLLTQGEEDTVTPKEFSSEFFAAIPATRKTYALLPGTRHESLREPDNRPVREAVSLWLDEGN